MSWVRQLIEGTEMKVLDGRPHACPQPVWAQALSGRSWCELGCAGYAAPRASLNDVQILSEDDLRLDGAILPGQAGGTILTINMPLLKPKPGRLWLSDGSLPMPLSVSPPELLSDPLFARYKPRPYSSSALASVVTEQSVVQCMRIEQERIACALHLIERGPWQSCFLRLSVFDLLSHMLGPDFLLAEKLSVWPDIEDFLGFLDRALIEICTRADADLLFVLSSFSHTACEARLNLNELLACGGFCRLASRETQIGPVIERRKAAIQAGAAQAVIDPLALVSPASLFDPSRTIAGSPVAGAVYLNRSDRFAEGTVAAGDLDREFQEVKEYLGRELNREFGGRLFMWSEVDAGRRCPELMIYVDGVELHDLQGSAPIDRRNRPRSTHRAQGFICLASGCDRWQGAVKPPDIYTVLTGALR